MKLLHDMMNLSENKEDLSRLPQDVMTSIKANIRKGAENLQQKWANALELVHKAYEVDGVQRPTPGMASAWKQYEENLQYAVQQLAKSRGMDADWRMSSSIFHEALDVKPLHRVCISDKGIQESYTTELDPTTLVKLFENGPFDVRTRVHNGKTELTFSRWGIQRNLHVTIEPLG